MNASAAQREYLTVPEVARLCSVSDRTAQRWCEKGSVPAVKTPTGRYRVPKDVLQDRADLLGYASTRSESLRDW